MKSIWLTNAYRICKFLDEHPCPFDVFEINEQALPKTPKETVSHILRVLMKEGFILNAGTRPIGKARRTLFKSNGTATSRYEDFKEKEYASQTKTKAVEIETAKVDKSFIMAALAAHPLHQWKGVQL